MDTSDKADKVDAMEKKKPGRPKKADPITPIGEYRIAEAKQQKERQGSNSVVEKYYELRGTKLSLVKRKKSGSVHRTLVGSTTDKPRQQEIKTFIDKLQKEGRLRIRV
jgi:hypothetical protein